MPAKNNLRAQVTHKMFETVKQKKRQDALALLKADHQEATELYRQFFKARSAARKTEIAGQLCLALSVHMRIEEDIFYPALQEAFKDQADGKQLIPEARVEHASLKRLITEVESAPENVEFEARVQVMCEYTRHHVKEEETEVFPKARKAGLDLTDLGEKLARRRLDLLDEMATKAAHRVRPPKPSTLFKQRAGRGRAARGNASRAHHARG